MLPALKTKGVTFLLVAVMLTFSSCANHRLVLHPEFEATSVASEATSETSDTLSHVDESHAPAEEEQSVTVYITKSGTKYHRAGCRYLSKSSMPVSLETLDTEKYSPCSICKPPPK